MNRILYAVCPRCGKRATIIRHRWDWENEQDYVLVRCTCGRFEVPYDDSRVLDIDLNNPYMEEEHFKLLLPPDWDDSRWSMIGGHMMHSWAFKG